MAYLLGGAHIPAFFLQWMTLLGTTSIGGTVPPQVLGTPITNFSCILTKISCYVAYMLGGAHIQTFLSVSMTLWGTGRRCPHYKLQLHIKENKLLHVLLVRRVTYTSIFFFSSSVDDTIGHNIYWGHSASTCPRFPHYKL